MKEEDQVKVLQQIIEMRDIPDRCGILRSNFEEGTQIKQGQFIFALHPFASVMQCIGYAVQVRKKVGQFGSDLILIRMANGGLQAWENQAFFNMTVEQEELARKVFEDLPENEIQYADIGYKADGVREVGFLIENAQSETQPLSSNAMVTITNGDSTTHISFI